MAFGFPVALEVGGRRCVVFGSGPIARARAIALLEAGAEVTVIPRPYEEGDLAGFFLAVSATGDADETTRIFAEAEREGVLLNAVDDPAHCHFAIPAVLRRGDLTVTVSTGGRAPGYARRLRDELSRTVGVEYGALVDLIGTVRDELRAERSATIAGNAADFEQWAARWRDALQHDLIGLVRAGRTGEARTVLRAALAEDDHQEAVA
ncbi:MAG TPA: bifunctional precorrin-2 dehydrogenase/sirohydrochlorin ferrochelatase [Acidimicrobiia bacterium]|nr:bifunctional precorrin-2 dehydrogenase/sirohydrochlorin ferrochelatase [Acidimicrobiia bacterium]